MNTIIVILGGYCIWSADQRTVELDGALRARVPHDATIVERSDTFYPSTKRYCERQEKLFFISDR